MVRQLSDAEILNSRSTSPSAEGPDFVDNQRRYTHATRGGKLNPNPLQTQPTHYNENNPNAFTTHPNLPNPTRLTALHIAPRVNQR